MTRKGWFSKASSQVNGHNGVSIILLRDIGKSEKLKIGIVLTIIEHCVYSALRTYCSKRHPSSIIQGKSFAGPSAIITSSHPQNQLPSCRVQELRVNSRWAALSPDHRH